MELEKAFRIVGTVPTRQEAEFPLRGVSLSEYLAHGLVKTVSPWIIGISDREETCSGYRTGRIDASFSGLRIREALESLRLTEGWRVPSITELATFAVETRLSTGPIVALSAHDADPSMRVPWAPYICGDLLGMWPVSHILPRGSSVMFIR